MNQAVNRGIDTWGNKHHHRGNASTTPGHGQHSDDHACMRARADLASGVLFGDWLCRATLTQVQMVYPPAIHCEFTEGDTFSLYLPVEG